jgi:hypothetical protein
VRLLLAVCLLTLASPAFAQDWQRYEDPAFGYAVDLPAQFTLAEQSSDHFLLKQGTTEIEVFALDVAPLGFDEAVNLAMRSTTEEGLAIVSRNLAPDWARYTAARGARQLAAGLVALCGKRVAGYELRFMEADGAAVAAVVQRLDASLQRTGTCRATSADR